MGSQRLGTHDLVTDENAHDQIQELRMWDLKQVQESWLKTAFPRPRCFSPALLMGWGRRKTLEASWGGLLQAGQPDLAPQATSQICLLTYKTWPTSPPALFLHWLAQDSDGMKVSSVPVFKLHDLLSKKMDPRSEIGQAWHGHLTSSNLSLASDLTSQAP